MVSDSTPQSNLRVLVIPDKYLPDECAGGAIYTDMCRGLAARGMNVTVRCPYSFYPEWRDKTGQNGFRIDRVMDHGVMVERHGFFIPRNPRSAVQRMLLDATFFASLSRSLFRGEFDAVIALCPHTGGVAFAVLHKLIHRSPFCLSVMDLPANAAKATGINRSGWLQWILETVQGTLFNQADVWRSISPAMIEKLKAMNTKGQEVHFIPDWLHPSLDEAIRKLPNKIGRPMSSPLKLLYSGNIGTKQGLLEFCKALQSTSLPFEFRIQGSGGNAASLHSWIASVGDPRFAFHPLSDEVGFAKALHESDLYVVTEKANIGSSFFPSKTIPGMASATPILAVSDQDSPLGREVREHGLGPWFTWDRLGEIPDVVRSLSTSPETFADWQRNAVQRGKFFERERCLDLLEVLLKNMAESQNLGKNRSKAVSAVPLKTG